MAHLFVVFLLTVLLKGCAGAEGGDDILVVSAVLGSDVVLPCNSPFEENSVHIAQWFRDQVVSTSPIAQKFQDKWEVSTKYNLTANFDLYVRDVEVFDEAQYRCFVSPSGLDNDYTGTVNLRLSAYPDESTSLIQGCGKSDVMCHRSVVVGEFVVVVCRATDVYPEVYPEWTTIGSNINPTIAKTSTEDKGGIYTTSVELRFETEVTFESELVCGFDYGDYTRSSSILLRVTDGTTGAPPGTTPTLKSKSRPRYSQSPTSDNIILIVAIVVPLIIIIISIILVLFLVKRKRIAKKKDEKVLDVDYTAVNAEDKGIATQPKKPDAKERRNQFMSNRQETILDDYKLKT